MHMGEARDNIVGTGGTSRITRGEEGRQESSGRAEMLFAVPDVRFLVGRHPTEREQAHTCPREFRKQRRSQRGYRW